MASLLVNSYVAIFIRSVINSEQGAAIYSCVTLSHQSINIYKYAMYIYVLLHSDPTPCSFQINSHTALHSIERLTSVLYITSECANSCAAGEKSVRKNVSVTAFECVCSLMIHYKCILTFLRTSVQLARLSVARKLQFLATN